PDLVWRGFFVSAVYHPQKSVKTTHLPGTCYGGQLPSISGLHQQSALSRSPRRTFAATSHFLALSIWAASCPKLRCG
ncbi:hypothetical protein, partial [Pseudomonas syringae group genomosp. 3]|uniref:hypothetical protein n=1 Tax=Pseudomonas syringae group genomosp. 3 TaxID=251701 RepID=UPI001E476624